MASSLLSLQPYNYFFINLLYQPYIEMANHLIHIEDVASITASSINNTDNGDTTKEPDTEEPHSPVVNNNKVISQDDNDKVPGLAPAPLATTLLPQTAVMVLEATGPTDGNMLVDNAKDFAATIHLLKNQLDEAHERAYQAEDQLEELEQNKENKAPAGNHGVHHLCSNSSGSGYDLPEYASVCPAGFKDNHGQAQGFYIPDDDGHQVEPKFIRFVQGANPHTEGTQGQGFPLFIHHLYAPTNYKDADLPLAQMPIWFTTTLSHHNNMYNVVLRVALEHNNWGICTDLIHYHQAEDQIGVWEAQVEEATQWVEHMREEHIQAQYCLEAACAH
jgi:hypothetical protein